MHLKRRARVCVCVCVCVFFFFLNHKIKDTIFLVGLLNFIFNSRGMRSYKEKEGKKNGDERGRQGKVMSYYTLSAN